MSIGFLNINKNVLQLIVLSVLVVYSIHPEDQFTCGSTTQYGRTLLLMRKILPRFLSKQVYVYVMLDEVSAQNSRYKIHRVF